MIEGGHAWRGQAQGINLDKVLGPDPVAEHKLFGHKLFGLEPCTITALGRKEGLLLSHN